MTRFWIKSLETDESIGMFIKIDFQINYWKKNSFYLVEHITIFQQDLYQLFEQLKQFIFLDIHAYINRNKVQSYRSMVQKSFPNSRVHINMTRFRLWL